MGSLSLYHFTVVVIGLSAFVLVVGGVIYAIVRASRRPAPLHSAAARLREQSPLPPQVEAALHELDQLKGRGVVSEAEYAQRRQALLQSQR
jgi:hypothetical protein